MRGHQRLRDVAPAELAEARRKCCLNGQRVPPSPRGRTRGSSRCPWCHPSRRRSKHRPPTAATCSTAVRDVLGREAAGEQERLPALRDLRRDRPVEAIRRCRRGLSPSRVSSIRPADTPATQRSSMSSADAPSADVDGPDHRVVDVAGRSRRLRRPRAGRGRCPLRRRCRSPRPRLIPRRRRR